MLAVFWGLAVVVFLQFFTRYVLNSSLGWTEEIARYLLIVVTFLGSAMAVRKRSHIAVEFCYRYFGPAGRHRLALAVDRVVPRLLRLRRLADRRSGAAHQAADELGRSVQEPDLLGGVPGPGRHDPLRRAATSRTAGAARPRTRTCRTAVWSTDRDAAGAPVPRRCSACCCSALRSPWRWPLSSLLFVLVEGKVPDIVVMHRMINGVDSFPLLAVPFFILAGNLMNTAGITNRIYDFAKALVGWMRGGLGQVNVGGSVIFAGMSGTAVADAGGLGTIEIKAMRDHGYDIDFAVGITAASSTIGPIIPPSLPMVIYGVMAGASIGQLFAAGFVPGLLMAVALMIMVAWYARRRNYPRDATFSAPRARPDLRPCLPGPADAGDHHRRDDVRPVHPDRGRRRRLRLGAVPGGRRSTARSTCGACCASASTPSRPRPSCCSSSPPPRSSPGS